MSQHFIQYVHVLKEIKKWDRAVKTVLTYKNMK